MGIIFSRFSKNKSVVELLEKLENDIKELEENKSYAQTKHRKIKKLLYAYSLGMCLICGLIFYFQYSSTFREKLFYLIPLALSPLLLLLISRIISWHYGRLIRINQTRLVEMKKEKKRILEQVMDTETYKVAKEILDKYSTESVPKQVELRRRTINTTNQTGLLQPQNQSARVLSITKNSGGQKPQLNSSPMPPTPRPGPVNHSLTNTPINQAMMRLPAPVFPLERSYMDRMVEYLIGDGPNNRFALICSRCHSHNGMALKEEFEYMSFKCCYCFFYNPARKIRPEAPKLEESITRNQTVDSDSDSKSAEENDEAPKKTDVIDNKTNGDTNPSETVSETVSETEGLNE